MIFQTKHLLHEPVMTLSLAESGIDIDPYSQLISFRFISTDFIFNMKILGLKNIERKENEETCMNTILNNNIRD